VIDSPLVTPAAPNDRSPGTATALRADLPVVLSSGYNIGDLGPQLADPNTVFLAKPYTAEDLVRAVRAAMSD